MSIFAKVMETANRARVAQQAHYHDVAQERREELHRMAEHHERKIQGRKRRLSPPKNDPLESGEYILVAEAAKIIGVSAPHVSHLIKDKKIPGMKISNGRWAVRRVTAEKIAEARKDLQSRQADHTFYERALM